MNWEEIVDHYGETIYRAAFQLLHDTHEAEDVAQEVLIEIFRNGLNPDRGLLRRMAAFRAIDRLRRRKGCEPFDDSNHESLGAGTLELIGRQELATSLREAMARLPPRQSRCFWMRYVDGLSYREIAEFEEVSVSAVSTALGKAKANLRSYLGNTLENAND